MEHGFDFEKYQKKVLSETLETSEYDELYRVLLEKEAAFGQISRDSLSAEYLAAKLALTSHYWEIYCGEYLSEKSKTYRKAFFKAVMSMFQSPKMLPLASAFSEYIFDSGEEGNDEAPSVAAALKLFRRLQLQEKIVKKTKAGEEVSPAFRFLVETFEGFRASFENDFLKFAGFNAD